MILDFFFSLTVRGWQRDDETDLCYFKQSCLGIWKGGLWYPVHQTDILTSQSTLPAPPYIYLEFKSTVSLSYSICSNAPGVHDQFRGPVALTIILREQLVFTLCQSQ